MTRQEKKEELIGLFLHGAITIGDLIDECFEFGQQHPRWISVEDELPKEKGWYLIYDSSMSHDVCMWYGDCWGNCYNITHWMPIPEAPKKGGEQ